MQRLRSDCLYSSEMALLCDGRIETRPSLEIIIKVGSGPAQGFISQRPTRAWRDAFYALQSWDHVSAPKRCRRISGSSSTHVGSSAMTPYALGEDWCSKQRYARSLHRAWPSNAMSRMVEVNMRCTDLGVARKQRAEAIPTPTQTHKHTNKPEREPMHTRAHTRTHVRR